MNAQPNYSRMPGFGDLPGDSSNPNSPDHDSSRDEWIGARATEIAERRMADRSALTDVVAELIGFSDWGGTVAGNMAAVISASDATFGDESTRFFAQLYKRVRADVRDAARAEAAAERDSWEREQDEARAESRGGWVE